MKTFNINGREIQYFYLTNNELIDLLDSDISNEDKEFITKQIIKRFEYNNCCRPNEDNHNVFVRQFSDFVNGKCHNKEKVAKLMANDHRYLQQEMFLIFMSYVEVLSNNFENGFYDDRNKWSCEMANKIQQLLLK